MHFGLFGGVRTKRGPGLGDSLGHHGFLMVKHHFTGQGPVSASMTLLACLVARTRSIRLGTAEVMPVQVAAE